MNTVNTSGQWIAAVCPYGEDSDLYSAALMNTIRGRHRMRSECRKTPRIGRDTP